MKPSFSVINPSEAHAHLDRYLTIDVREPNEFTGELGRIAGSRLVPLRELIAHIERGEARELLFGGAPGAAGAEPKPLLVVCRSGNRSGMACQRLAEAGIAGATNLVGGMLEWNRLGLPVERGEPGGAAGGR